MKTSRIENTEISNRRYRVRHWGPEGAPALFMLHGWLDCSATFQFVVDTLKRSWHIIAPDWRGHGGSFRTGETYLFIHLLADLDAILQRYSPNAPACIVGHSMGGNAASIYSGTRPERVAKLVNLEGLAPVPGLWKGTPADQLGSWLANLRKGLRNRSYPDRQALAERLRVANPRLSPDRARFLAQEFGAQQPDGTIEIDVDPYQQARMPMVEHESLVESTWPRITARVLLITGADSDIYNAFNKSPGAFERRRGLFPNVEHVNVSDAGHNLHHDQPEQVGALIERFL